MKAIRLTGIAWLLIAGLSAQVLAEEPEDAEEAAFQDVYDHPDKGREAFILRLGDFALSLNPHLQVQTHFYLGDDSLVENGDVATTEGFRIRRARVGFHGSWKQELGLNLVVDLHDDLAGGNVIHAANLVYRPWAFANFALGTAPVLFCRGSMTSSAKLQLIERPATVQALSAESQLGFAVMGKVLDGELEYGAGIYNGGPGFTHEDLGEGFLYAGRIQYAPFGEMPSGESDRDNSPLRMAVGLDYYYSHDSSIDTHAFSADLALKWRGLSVLAEWLYDMREPEQEPALPPAISGKTDRRGWYVQAGYFVLGDYLEVAARFEWLDDNIFIADTGDLWLLTGGVNGFLLDGQLKLQLNYIHKDERNAPELDNDVLFLQAQVDF
ncbi:MAG: hypothetical protein JXR96_17805 [Deltaproteobacteria bacterium]|nr:hypothetical protein [Deltaproteobacteria bacterium]